MDLRIEDLWEKCQACNGTGRPPPPPPPPPMGMGPVQYDRCQKCDGKGGQPTSNGRIMLEFLRLAGR
jgi:hypothetical protein